MSELEILVHVDLDGVPVLAGRLFMRVVRGQQSASFLYDRAWLGHPRRFALDPATLPLGGGTFSTPGGQRIFGGLSDSAPDRWGRTLMARQARLSGQHRTLFESDYLLGVHDGARLGALRFKLDAGGPFLADSPEPIPPVVRLGELLSASDRLQTTEADAEALRLLLAPGSSLGGARPKASVLDGQGRLSMAKFPARTDDWPVVVWEKIVADLARRAGVLVSDSELVDVAGRGVLVVQRFDRNAGRRIPFLSALALLGASDRDPDHSYLELADAIRKHGGNVEGDLRQLWRRMVFSVLVSNTDDHLRNHGFLLGRSGWCLAPAYDLNPVPLDAGPRVHALALDESDPCASLDTVLSVAEYFGLGAVEAREDARSVAVAVRGWGRVAARHGLDASQIERMESAFEHADLRQALGGVGS